MEEPGGGRRKRILGKSLTSHNKLSKCPCVPWVGSWQAASVFDWGEEEGFVVERESFLTKIV